MSILPRKILAIDISDSSIEIMQMSQFLGRIKVTFLSRSELEKGIVENGRIIGKKQLALKIREYCGSLKKNKVALALPDGVVSSHIFRFSGDRKISKEDVLAEAKKVLPMEINDSYWDFNVQDVGGEKVVLFAVAGKKDVDTYKAIFEDKNFDLKVLDLNSLCVLRAFDFDREGVLFVDLGGWSTTLSILDGECLRAIDVVGFGGEDVTEKISDKLKVSREEAESLKMNIGFDTDKEDGKVFLALEEILQPFVDGMRKTINSYEGSSKRKIKKIILSGGTGTMPKLGEYIYENFGINCEMVRPQMSNLVSEYLKVNRAKNGIDTIFFATTLGLAAKYLGIKTRFDVSVNLLK